MWTPTYILDNDSKQDLDRMDLYLRHEINHRIPAFFNVGYYESHIHKDYNAKSVGEWLFMFLTDRSLTHHKKERVLKILYESGGRGVFLESFVPLTFQVTSEPPSKKTKRPARIHQITVSSTQNWFCDCEWAGTVADDTCTHILASRAFMFLKTIGGRKKAL